MTEHLSQRELESYLWGAATLLRGLVDASDYKQYIFPLMFFKRLSDVWDEDYQDALMWAQRAKRHPNGTGYWPHAMMAAPLAHLGRIEEANLAVQKMLAAVPTLTIGELAKTYPTSEPGGLEPYLQGLRLAGLPE